MRFEILTLFPELFDNFKQESLIYRAQENALVKINTTDIRAFSQDRHHKVDDYPYGGGSGMLMKPEPVFRAHEHVGQSLRGPTKTLFMTPSGVPLNQHKVEELSTNRNLIILCGRYEGVDQRVIDKLVDEEISIGDYVLFGGELPAMVLIEAITRLIPGVLGNASSLEHESFSNGLLEYPQYTKPRTFQGMSVPDVLLSGNHEEIRKWRQKKAIEKTRIRRPDLLANENEKNGEEED